MTLYLFIYQNLVLLIYSTLKAFLPLPSLEVILIPLIIAKPNYWLLYSLIGSLGTFFGGSIGYYLAKTKGRSVLKNLVSIKEIDKGNQLMNKYGILAVFIGGITPIPDFLLAYLAGFSQMPFFKFALCDAVARLIRSLLVSWSILVFGSMIDIDTYGTYLSLILVIYLLIKWMINKYRIKKEQQLDS